jgi:hypothetical protein
VFFLSRYNNVTTAFVYVVGYVEYSIEYCTAGRMSACVCDLVNYVAVGVKCRGGLLLLNQLHSVDLYYYFMY